jgi:hypothetical protein
MVEDATNGGGGFWSEGRLELLTAIMLGLAALATAWAAFQGSQYDGEMLTSFTEANLYISDANSFYSEGDQIYSQDEQIFLEYEKAIYAGDEEFAQHLQDTLMSDQLIAAIAWWELPENQDYYSPFVEENPNYVIDSYTQADELIAESDASFEAGAEANETGDKFNLITVLLAASLFVLGISNGFKVLPMRLATIGIGAAIFLGSTIWMLTLPAA